MTEENKTDNGHPIHPFDMKPTIELTVPLTVDLFVFLKYEREPERFLLFVRKAFVYKRYMKV